MKALVFWLCFFLVYINEGASAQKLQQYNVDKSNISVFGISSGGAMAIQVHVSHSSIFMGMAAIGASPYWCANANVGIGVTSCMKDPDLIILSELYAATAYAEGLGSIDNTKNLANSKVLLLTGKEDSVVVSGIVQKSMEYCQHYNPASGNCVLLANIPAEHAWLTSNYGNPCGHLGSPYINNCNFDFAGNSLKHIYGNVNAPGNISASNMLTFSQKYYTPIPFGPADISLDDIGFIYVPSSCQTRSIACKLVIALHGCDQNFGTIGNVFLMNNGLNPWAETNNIIVVYPQTKASSLTPYNPKACWDWWGYSGLDYATKLGPQIGFLKNIIDTLTG